MRYHIYVVENTVNGKSYVGMTKDLVMRWGAHKNPSTKTPLSRDIKLFGIENFICRVLDIAENFTEAGNKERLYTHLLESNVPEFGYNSPGLYIWETAEKKIDRWLVSRGRTPMNNIQPLRARRNAITN